MKIWAPVALGAMLLASCATTAPPPTFTLAAPFNAADFAWSRMEGKNTIAGDAVLRTVGGDVKTCAGYQVQLLPATAYTQEYVTRRFKSPQGGYAPFLSILQGTYTLDTGLGDFKRTTTCNAQGAFTFSGLADGSYFVIAKVEWQSIAGGGYYYYNQTQGGDIALKVTVAGGETQVVTLTA